MWQRVVLLAAVGTLALAGCGQIPNYSGKGSEFDISAVVSATGTDSIRIQPSPIEIHTANGRAQGYFHSTNTLVSSDHLNLLADYDDLVRHYSVGHVYNATGTEITPQSVPIGSHIRVTGTVHDRQGVRGVTLTCPIFNKVQIVS